MPADTSGSNHDAIPLGFAGLQISAGDHVGHFYRTREEWAGLATGYVKTGLAAGEKCVYLVGTAGEVETFARRLEAEGVPVEAAVSRGQLDLREAPDGPETLRALMNEAIAEVPSRFPFLRWGADMTWALRKMPSCEKLMELESGLNAAVDARRVFLCQYDLKSFMGHAVMDALHTHRLCVVGRTLHTNSLYD